jgi:hypothetical protein
MDIILIKNVSLLFDDYRMIKRGREDYKREHGLLFNNVGMRFQVFKLFKKLSKLPKTLNNEILCFFCL